MKDENKCCGNCIYHKPFGDEFGCDNEDSEAYGLETQFDDYCEDYEEKEDDEG